MPQTASRLARSLRRLSRRLGIRPTPRISKLQQERNSLSTALSASDSETETVRTIHTEVQNKLELVESLSAFYHLIHYALAELPGDLRSTSSYGIKKVTFQLIQAVNSYEGLPRNVDKQVDSSTDCKNIVLQLIYIYGQSHHHEVTSMRRMSQ